MSKDINGTGHLPNTSYTSVSVTDIRSGLANSILVCISIFGAPIVFFTYLRYLKVGVITIVLLNFTIYLICLAVTIFRKKISLKARSLIIICASFLIAINSILKWGLIGVGIPYFIFCSILATVFLGVRPAVITTSINLLILAIVSILFNTELIHHDFNLGEYALALPSWISTGSAYGVFTIILVICLGRLYRSMDVSIEKLTNQAVELHQAKEKMEKEMESRKHAETALMDSEERFRTILENLPISIFVHDLEGKNIIVNKEACNSTGYSKEDLLNKTVEEIEPETFNMDEATALWQELVKTGESSTLETVTNKKDGSEIDAEVHLKSIILQGRPVIMVMVFDISERKKAENDLRESEERFRTVLENIPCGVSVHDLEGRHLIVNEETCRVKGYAREELLEKTVMETAGPAFGSTYKVKSLWDRIELGASFTFETLTQRKDGSDYDSEVHLTKLMLEGQPVILSLVFDITERKKIEKNLAYRSELEHLISEISSGIIRLGYDDIDEYINKTLASIGNKTGVDHAYLFLFNPENEEINSINEWALDDKVPLINALGNFQPEISLPWFTNILKSQDIVHIPDIEMLPPEAHKEKIYFRALRIKSLIVFAMKQEKNLIGFLGFDSLYKNKSWSEDEIIILRILGETFFSAIKRKQVEEEQKKLQAQLATAVDLAQLGPWELDMKNKEYNFNDHFYKIYHTTAEEMGGYKMTVEQYIHRFVHPDDVHLINESLRMGRRPGAPVNNRIEHRVFYADGTMGYVMANIFRIKNSEGITIKSYGFNQDITEWKISQEKIRESEEKLARSKKMESLGLLAGGVAHDLNNVLSGIVSYPELLLMDLPENDKMRKSIEIIQESGEKAAAIVQDLLTIARGAVTTKETLNLNDIIEEYLSSPEFIKLKGYHPSVSIDADLYPDLLNIKASSIHIKKVIMNLVSNASEAIEGKGDVNISTRNIYLDNPISRYEDVKIGEYILLSVSDNGPGIAPNNLERIFEPFFTKKVMGVSGTGLGLAVVWNIVQDHFGYIDVKSDENGTQFDLYFPITREEFLDDSASVMLEQIKGRGEKILVVDDMESQRVITCRMLEMLGYEYESVASGEEAIAYVKENSVDLLLLDMIMEPGISGRETYEEIVKIHPDQKAIIVSGFSKTEDVVAIQKLGAGKYIKKPFTLEALGSGIKNELTKENS